MNIEFNEAKLQVKKIASFRLNENDYKKFILKDMKIFDCFMYFDEDVVLDVKIKYFDKFVD